MTQNKMVDKIKTAHDHYYSKTTGPIGGGDRFAWIHNRYAASWKNLRILEIGCGEGSLLGLLAGNNEVHGVDISLSGVEQTRKKGFPCHHLDASNEALPYLDGTFDVVITLETIEHVENPHRMIWEIKRVLKDGGDLLISIPGEAVYHPFIYPGLFTRRNFDKFLTLLAFDVLGVSGWGQAPMLAHWTHRVREGHNPFLLRLADVIYYIGRKRNLLFRKHLKTPLAICYTMNFLCRNHKSATSRVEKIGDLTTPRE
jgi:2-polyprenyl-3-methyl-5-hydroxy-6-metoxy-1,4-benzoquinol methylase